MFCITLKCIFSVQLLHILPICYLKCIRAYKIYTKINVIIATNVFISEMKVILHFIVVNKNTPQYLFLVEVKICLESVLIKLQVVCKFLLWIRLMLRNENRLYTNEIISRAHYDNVIIKQCCIISNYKLLKMAQSFQF